MTGSSVQYCAGYGAIFTVVALAPWVPWQRTKSISYLFEIGYFWLSYTGRIYSIVLVIMPGSSVQYCAGDDAIFTVLALAPW